jgi:diguanylate cyclase (GGDEF)-like protein
MNDNTDLQTFLQHDLPIKIVALESVKVEIQAKGAAAVDSAKRLAYALRISCEPHGLTEIVEAALTVEESSGFEAENNLNRLLETLKRITSDDQDESVHKILIIEDDLDMSQLTSLTLQSQGRNIYVAKTTEEARALLDRYSISIILLNLILPDMDGRNLLIELKSDPQTADIPVFMMSIESGQQVESECMALGAETFINKPYDPKNLASIVTEKLKELDKESAESGIDKITGLFNRASFSEAYMKATSFPLVIALLDVDYYKTILKKHGKEFAHQVLDTVADSLKQTAKEIDIIARWETSTFVAIFPQETLDEVTTRLEKVLDSLRSSPLKRPDGTEVPVTFSAGIDVLEEPKQLTEAIADLDHYLYFAQSLGKNQIVTPFDDLTKVRRKILFLEDDELTAMVVKHRLEREEFEVIHHQNGQDAVDAIPGATISLFILDVKVPVLDGFEVLERIRKMPSHQDTPVIMLTSMGSEKDIKRGFDMGANDYIP